MRQKYTIQALTVEAVADDLTGVGDQNKRGRLDALDIAAQLHRLRRLHCSKNDVLVLPGKSALRAADRRAAGKIVGDKRTDRGRIVADNIEILAEVDVLNHRIND